MSQHERRIEIPGFGEVIPQAPEDPTIALLAAISNRLQVIATQLEVLLQIESGYVSRKTILERFKAAEARARAASNGGAVAPVPEDDPT